ncbi:DUF4302 domain-containing protein [Dyadobacter sandarakinus]|uniref:DUF4302 domain-containing protein n=1 Tax=Dyadobacter sandarakinus TaxID=2747268 RepID=A0ABX7I753_9BACT|nr:DUF4302 domain-containing protein [Dyadobacter sandarakinus]QRR01936.1 DUF4302 domain-containing protein [Dyadobacter sandarakinus]
MKNSLLYFLFIGSVLFGCERKEDTVFEETADTRLNAALASYEKQLVEASSGWNAVIYPAGGGSYGFYFKFNNQNRVVMYSDFTDSSAATPKESSYRLKALQTPALIFDTYSYLHVLADPDAEVNGGDLGVGLLSDFEFSIFPDSVKTDVITLVGRQNKSRLVLTRASEAQAAAYTSGALAKAVLFNNITKYPTYFKRITLGNTTYEITANATSRTMKLTWLEGATPRNFTTTYYFTSAGLVFTTPLVNGSQTIAGFSNVTWNANTVQLGFSGGGASGVVASAVKPVAVDAAAPRRWWQAPVASGAYWRSWTGFSVNGVEDAFGISKLTSTKGEYAYVIYQPISARYDYFGPVFFADNVLDNDYAYAPIASFTTDGRVIFKEGGGFGMPAPTTGPAASTINLLYDASGFYLVQTSPTTYDMVSAKDARAWISWF